MGIAVSGRGVSMPSKAAVVRTTTGLKAPVPGLYCLGSVGRVTTYHIYIIRVRKGSHLIASYGGIMARNVIVCAGDPGMHVTEERAMRLVLSRRSYGYTAYIEDMGYALRRITGSLGLVSLPFGRHFRSAP